LIELNYKSKENILEDSLSNLLFFIGGNDDNAISLFLPFSMCNVGSKFAHEGFWPSFIYQYEDQDMGTSQKKKRLRSYTGKWGQA
jgi:hypothetical protein